MPTRTPARNARSVALSALEAIDGGAYTSIALERALHESGLPVVERALATEIVYGVTRRRLTLDRLIDQFALKPARLHPLARNILRLALYQIRNLDHVPPSAAVNTAVGLARQKRLGKLADFINGLLRTYLRAAERGDPLELPSGAIERLSVQHSFPPWLVELWCTELGEDEAARLCEWFNHPAHLDLRVNLRSASTEAVRQALADHGVESSTVEGIPQSLRLTSPPGAIERLPGFEAGHWVIQEAGAQLVGWLVDPRSGERVIDCCAAPGGKTTHLAELMDDRGRILAFDRNGSRLERVVENQRRLGLTCIESRKVDVTSPPADLGLVGWADRVLLDAPCSGLGTLHRHPDGRWRKSPADIPGLVNLQQQLLEQASTWVRTGGALVYATCTLHPDENEGVVNQFLATHPSWQSESLPPDSPVAPFSDARGYVRLWPHRHDLDGFFMVRLRLV